MRDQHRDKRDLINEVTDLRKQVADLKQSALERRRVEDGLRTDRELSRALLNQAAQPLCLVNGEGQPLIANQSFVDLLGYTSAGELVRLGGALGLILGDMSVASAPDQPLPVELTLRRGDGAGVQHSVLASTVPGTELWSLTVVASRQPA